MELAIAHLETPYALAVRAANDGIWDWDLVAETISFSPRWHAILGRPHPEGDQSPAAWLDLVHPADAERLRAAIRSHLDGRSPQLRAEHRMRHADGSGAGSSPVLPGSERCRHRRSARPLAPRRGRRAAQRRLTAP
ncbi:MAG: PAS domain-containing protein [Solirubrobacteraceae bacterium]